MKHQDPFFVEIRIRDTQQSRSGYDEIYEQTELSQMESFYLWLMDRLDLPARGSLLDVSCGAGEVVRLAAQRGLKATGIDLSEMATRKAARSAGPYGGTFSACSGEYLPFPSRCFDVVTNIGSLEHFMVPAMGVREMSRVLKPDGKAYILVPNTFSLLTNILYAWRTGETSVDSQPIQRYGARCDWVHLLEQNGLRVVRTQKYERPWPRTSQDWGYFIKRPKEIFRLLAAPFIPLNLTFCFLFTCEPVFDTQNAQ